MDDIVKVIIAAGGILKEKFLKSVSHTRKEKFDLVTNSDIEVESVLINEISKIYPGDSFYSEEIGGIPGRTGRRWVIDPIDGTANFVFGVPFFCISICLEEKDEIIEGYVYNPITEEFYHSNNRENVSYLNGNQIKVSSIDRIEDVLVSFGFSANYTNINKYYEDWSYLFENCKKGMGLLSPALNICNVARGRIDCFIDFGSSMEGQSVAALILKNAGGNLRNYDLSPWDYKSKGIIAVNSSVLNILEKCHSI